MKKLTILVLAILLAVLAQVYLVRRSYPFDALIFFAMAGFLALRSLGAGPQRVHPIAPVTIPTSQRIRLALAAAFLLNGAAFVVMQNPAQGNLGFVLWAGSLVIIIAALWRVPGQGTIKRERETMTQYAILVGILVLAGILRLYQIDSFPPGLYLDESDFAYEGVKTAQSPVYTPFTPAITGHHTFFLYYLGYAVNLAGNTPLTIRLAVALLGILTIPAFYRLARELFSVNIALILTFLLAVSRWHIIFSRIAFPGVMVPLFACLAAFFFLRALRTGRPLDYVWSALAMGAGLNSYIAVRIFPLIIGIFGLYLLLARPAARRQVFIGLTFTVLITILAYTPNSAYFIKHPQDFTGRAASASVFLDIQREKSNEPLYANLRRAVGMFNYQGDPRPRHNLPHAPELDPLTGIIFALGFFMVLYTGGRADSFFLMTWLVIGLVPGVLSLADSNPHSLRTITSIPAAFLIPGIFLERVWMEIPTWLGQRWAAYLVRTAVPTLGIIALLNIHTYFVAMPADRSVYYDFDPVQTQVALSVRTLARANDVYVAQAFTNHANVKYLDLGVHYQTFSQAQHLPLREGGGRPAVFILEPVQATLVPLILQYYPSAQVTDVRDRYGNPGYIQFTIPPEAITAAQGIQARYYRGLDASGQPAAEAVEGTLDKDWAKEHPLDPPFTGEWRASLYVPRYGPYTLVLTSQEPATLTLNDETIISGTGRMEKSLTLPAGFHKVIISTTVTKPEGMLRFAWRPGGEAEAVVPRTALFTLNVASNGLLGKYYRGNNWSGTPAIIQKDLFIWPNDLLPAPFSIEWEGKIYAPRSGTYTFGTSSDDGSFFYIDGKLVVDNGGHHSERYVEGRVQLTEGFHDIRLRYFQDDGGRAMQLFWTPPGGGRELVPSTVLFPPGAIPTPPPVAIQPPQGPSPLPTPTPGPLPPAPETAHLTSLGAPGSGPGEFNDPRGVAVDAQGNIYVADTGNRRVQKLDSSGHILAEIRGTSEGPFVEPAAVAIGPGGEIYVLDPQKDAVYRFSPNGEYQAKVAESAGLYRPRGLTVDRNGTIYVTNTGGNTVVRYAPTGQPLGRIGSGGKGPGQVDQPTDTAISRTGDLFVVDTYNRRVQHFTSDGRVVGEWPIPGAGTVFGPHAAFSPDETVLFITDPDNHRVNGYALDGGLVVSFGSEGSGNGQFRTPVGIAIDRNGRIYVADAGNHRIQIFGK